MNSANHVISSLKKLLPLTSFWALLFFATTQQASAQKVRLGLKVAPTLAWLKSNSTEISSDGAKAGFTYGVISDFYFSENYAFSSGLDIVYKGGSLKAGSLEAVKYDLQCLEIPLMLKMRTNQIGHFLYFGQFGLAGSVKLKSNEDVNPLGLSLLIGAGLEVPFSGKTAFVSGLTFHNGFTDVIPGEYKAISNYVALNLGILF